MPQRVINLLEAIAVEIEQRKPLLLAEGDGLREPRFKQGAIGQSGESIVGRLMEQAGIFAGLLGLPGLQLVQQGVEVIPSSLISTISAGGARIPRVRCRRTEWATSASLRSGAVMETCIRSAT